MIRLCTCGFATDDDEWFLGYLDDYPGHHEREAPRAFLILAGRIARV
jgi:hypothetical protein